MKKLLRIYRKSGIEIDTETEILILEDIDNWLFDDFGGYHFTKICDLSSKIYYRIIQYVRPIYDKCTVREGNGRYSYIIPENVTKKESKFEFYELLNHIRSPFLPKIETWEHLKGRY